MNAQSAYQEEQRRLAESLREIEEQLRSIGPRYTGNDFTEQMLDLQKEERKKRLEIARKEPYFGRLDFQELESGSAGDAPVKPLYIGKAGVADKNGKELLVIDWRAPAASLFYSFTGGDGPASYDSPDGEVLGNVFLKRNFMIRGGEMLRMVDSYTRGSEEGAAATDEFLLYRLGETKDNKLRDIVSTIQSEQDRIIRAERGKALFIQGVAGSGKTTVALHRLAFLIYQYADRMRADRMIIFAPNRMFLDYISGVLPELGVGDIGQTTFADWAMELLEHAVAPEDPSESLAYWFEQRRSEEEWRDAPGRWKGSLACKAAIDGRIAGLMDGIVPKEPYCPLDGLILPPEQMREWFETDYGDEPAMVKRERLASRIRRWHESALKQAGVTDKGKLKSAKSKLQALLKKMPSYTAVQLYRSLFAGKTAVPGLPKSAAKSTAERLGRGVAAAEDLAALVYIQLKLYGLRTSPFDHIVIDEAQDYSPLQLEALKLCQRTVSMTVLGDLQQGIHAYAGISSWEELTGLFRAEETGYFELNRSYRSTMEIIEYANRVLEGMPGGVKPAVPVFRSGDPVAETQVDGGRWLPAVISALKEWQQAGTYETIAVIGRTAEECGTIYSALRQHGLEASLVQSKQPAYGGGMSVVPVYLSKGLEFDAVLIADAGVEAYGVQDAKLLYVGCTRALHKLAVLYRGRLSPLLRRDDR